MFINIDYGKKTQELKLHLAKPNQQIISHISEKFNHKLSLKLGNINELNFSIPHFIEEELEIVENKHIELIKEKMLIRAKLGAETEWFVVAEIEEDGDDEEIFNVTAYSLGFELRGKRIREMKEETVNATDVLSKILKRTSWKIGTVDAVFDSIFRTIEGNDTNALDMVIETGKTFGALIVWNTDSRTVSFKDIESFGRFRGMTVDYGRFLRSIKKSRTSDELITRLYVYGNEDLSIHTINPTGQAYLENFEYFMYPFERDENKNVIRSSHFMSDALCNAILNQQSLIMERAPQIRQLTDDRAIKNRDLIMEDSKLRQYNLELEMILARLDMAKSTENQEAINNITIEREQKQTQINTQAVITATLKSEIANLTVQIQDFQDTIAREANFTPQLLDELDLYIIEAEWKDDRYIDVKELYDDALDKFEEMRQPKVVITVDIDNLFNILEEQYYWDKVILGDIIKVKYPQMKIEYKSRIVEIEYDFSVQEISITIANSTGTNKETEQLTDLLYKSSRASSLVSNSKYKWDRINSLMQDVNDLISGEWNANKNKIIAGVNNTIEVGSRGIIIKNPDFPNEVVIMQSGIIALSKDGGETWKTAIKPDGIVAERLIGKIIAGQELIITNNSGSFTFDNNGVQIDAHAFVVRSASQENMVDKWTNSTNFVEQYTDDNIITAFEKKMLKTKEWVAIKDKYDSISETLSTYYENGGINIPDISNLHSRYTLLYNYLFVTVHEDKPMLADDNMEFSTRIVREDFIKVFDDFNKAVNNVERHITLRNKELTKIAQDTANDAKKNIEEVENDIVYKIELTSSKGTVFRNNNGDTTITARVYRGMNDITSSIPNNGFIWKKFNNNGELDVAWTNSKVNIGNIITLTHQEVSIKAIISCDIKIENN